MENWKNVITCS